MSNGTGLVTRMVPQPGQWLEKKCVEWWLYACSLAQAWGRPCAVPVGRLWWHSHAALQTRSRRGNVVPGSYGGGLAPVIHACWIVEAPCTGIDRWGLDSNGGTEVTWRYMWAWLWCNMHGGFFCLGGTLPRPGHVRTTPTEVTSHGSLHGQSPLRTW